VYDLHACKMSEVNIPNPQNPVCPEKLEVTIWSTYFLPLLKQKVHFSADKRQTLGLRPNQLNYTHPIYLYPFQYRVIHKTLRDFRPLRYSSRGGHAEGEHINR
jgi:hypothetical protein